MGILAGLDVFVVDALHVDLFELGAVILVLIWVCGFLILMIVTRIAP